MKYSVIDISSSSISMMVADTNDRITEIIFRDRASLTLLHYLDGRDLSQRGIDKLVEAVSLMKDKCLSLGVDIVYLISTAALRAVGNFEEIGAAILNRTGLPVNAVDGQTEAYCDYIANRFYSAYESAVLLDIGGASVEICDLSADDRAQMHSLNFGILTLHNKFVEKIQPDEGEAKRIKKYVARKLDKADVPGEGRYATVVVVGTAALALYDIYAEFTGAAEPGERRMDYKKFKKLVGHLLTGRDRSKLILDVAPEKLYSVGIAAVIAKTVFRRFGAKQLLVSDRGVKEGYLQLVAEGKVCASFYDFAKEEAVILPVGQPEDGQEDAEGKAGEGDALPEQAVPAGAAPAGAEAKDAAGDAPKRRGRSAKAKAETAKRGRPAKAKAGAAKRGRPAKAKAETAKRGRPPKAKAGAAKRGRPAKEKVVESAENAAKSKESTQE